MSVKKQFIVQCSMLMRAIPRVYSYESMNPDDIGIETEPLYSCEESIEKAEEMLLELEKQGFI